MKTVDFSVLLAHSSKRLVIYISLILIGIGYFLINHVSIVNSSETASSKQQLFILHSHRDQQVHINILSPHAPIRVVLNEQPLSVDFPYPKTRVSHLDNTFGDIYHLPLQKGDNQLLVSTINGNAATIVTKRKYRFQDYLAVLFLILLPGSILLFQGFIRISDISLTPLKILFSKQNFTRLLAITRNQLIYLPLLILITGIAIRLWYAIDMGYIQFQHDYHGHIEYIRFFASEFFIPLPYKAWEFPQQPLYYIVNGFLYALLDSLKVAESTILKCISASTSLLVCIGLVYAWRLSRLISESYIFQSMMMLFLCLIPSFVYLSSRINNDPWAFSLSCIALFYIISSWQHHWQQQVFKAVLFTSLLFLTKITSLVIEVMFICLLLSTYITATKSTQRAMLAFGLAGVSMLSYTLFRAYSPVAESLAIVNSGIWPGQDLRPIQLGYFTSFNFSELLVDAQAHIAGTQNTAVTRSLPTYQYATMLFGEFNYEYWRGRQPNLYFHMQVITLLGLIVPIGWIAYLFKSRKTWLDIVFIITASLSIVLLAKFFITYPSVSNTDFRYHASILFILAYFFAQGIESLYVRFQSLKILFTSWLTLFSVTCISFILHLIAL